MKVAIVNCGMGNLGSVRRALVDLGADGYVAERPEALRCADRIVLPGVGAFAEGMARLRAGGWIAVLSKRVVAESDEQLLVRTVQRPHQPFERDVLQLVSTHLRHFGLRHAGHARNQFVEFDGQEGLRGDAASCRQLYGSGGRHSCAGSAESATPAAHLLDTYLCGLSKIWTIKYLYSSL